MARLVSWLFVPGAADRFMAKLHSVRPHVAVLDLEDGQAVEGLVEARQRVARVLGDTGAYRGVRLAVRTSPVASPEFRNDVAALGPNLYALVLPKTSDTTEVREAAAALERAGLSEVAVIPMVESARALRNAYEILTAHPSVAGVALGAEDLAADLGLPYSGGSPELAEGREAVLAAARAHLVMAAAAAGIEVRIESPHLALAADDAVAAAAAKARSFGFSAMFAVHPQQLQPIARGFMPSPEESEAARRVLAAGERGGAGVADGRMVDEAVYRQARRVLG